GAVGGLAEPLGQDAEERVVRPRRRPSFAASRTRPRAARRKSMSCILCFFFAGTVGMSGCMGYGLGYGVGFCFNLVASLWQAEVKQVASTLLAPALPGRRPLLAQGEHLATAGVVVEVVVDAVSGAQALPEADRHQALGQTRRAAPELPHLAGRDHAV